MSDTGAGTPDAPDPDPEHTPAEMVDGDDRNRAVIAVVLALVAAAVVLVVVLLVRGGDDDASDELTDLPTTTEAPVDDTTTTSTIPAETTTTAPETTTTAAAETTTTAPTTTVPATTTTTTTTISATTTTPAPPAGPTPEEEAFTVWPWVESDLRYDDPADAALGMMTELVDMFEPRVGEIMQGDAVSAEVEVFSGTFAIPTTVSVRQLSDGTWWVLGAFSPNLLLEQPAATDDVTSPIELRGVSTAIEANVLVDVFAVGDPEPLYEGFFSGGGSMGDMAPFEASIEIDPAVVPDEPRPIVLVLSTPDPRDAGRSEATAIRLTLTP